MVCEKCNEEINIGDWPFCPHGKVSYVVIGDECDVWIRHGLCNDDGSPRHYTSKEAMRRDAKAKGLVNIVEHVSSPESDKSKHTTRWI